jgi:ethanolamine ammonia-lyase small subunit
MVNENEIKSLVEAVLSQMMSKGQEIKSDEKKILSTATIIEDDEIPDITEVDIKTTLLVPNPADREGYLKMKQHTPARLGIWRAGPRYKTETSLRVRADHAAAQDSVFSYVSEEFVSKMNLLSLVTLCKDKDEYITRPDLGRRFCDEAKDVMKKELKSNAKVQIVVGDGLSSAAIEANLENILPAIEQGLKAYGLDFGKHVFVKHCRVPSMDVIGEVTNADVVCLLVGERPGLVTAESMSAYIAYKPTVGMSESRRTVISNIHSGGTPAVEAGAHISEIVKKMLEKKTSGIELKSE